MKNKLILAYETLLNNYFYYQNQDEETSKRFAYYSIRNMIGVSISMFLLAFLVTILAVFKINLHLRQHSLLLYPLFVIVIISYVRITKKYLKPLFDSIELKKEKPIKNNYYWYVLAAMLFGGGSFAIIRLIPIYLR